MPTETFLRLRPEKKDQIIRAAIDEFAVRTLEEANISNIVKAAGIARGSFYQYFQDKSDLFQYLFALIGQEKMKYLEETMAKRGQTPFMDFVLEVFEKALQFAQERPQYNALGWHAYATHNPVSERFYADNKNTLIAFYQDLIELDKGKGLIRQDADSRILATHFAHLTQDVFGPQIMSGEKRPEEVIEDLRNFLEMLCQGIAHR